MAKYKITSLNYITAGKKHAFINVDAALEYTQPTKIKILDDENNLSIITLDQGNIEYIETEHINKEIGQPLSQERALFDSVILREDQKNIKNVEAQDKSAILLKSTDDLEDKLDEIKAFQAQVSAINNLTFELELAENNAKNNMLQHETEYQMFPMYDIRNLAIKSNNKKKMLNRLYGTDKYVDIYAPSISAGPMKFCEANGYSYMLFEPTNATPQSLNAYVNDSSDDSYYMQIQSRKLKTYAYQSLDYLNEKALKNGQISRRATSYQDFFEMLGYDVSASMHMLFQPRYNYSNLKYNYLLDFDQNSTNLNYDTGDVYAANINLAKNIYNAVYTVDMPNSSRIDNTREYFTIGSMNNKVFLTFADDISYDVISRRDANEADIIDAKMRKTHKNKILYIDPETGEII